MLSELDSVWIAVSFIISLSSLIVSSTDLIGTLVTISSDFVEAVK